MTRAIDRHKAHRKTRENARVEGLLGSKKTPALEGETYASLRDFASGRIVVARLEVAQGVWQRSVGLLSRAGLEATSGLWLEPCNGVHTWFMRFTIDVVYLDINRVVLRLAANVPPWRVCLPLSGCRAILELPGGTAERLGILVGNQYQIDERPAP